MTFQIRDGETIWTVRTEVGDGPTRVVLEEDSPEEQPISFEASEE
jgi:hypothetical protein